MPTPVIAMRTSQTNIGLQLLATVSAEHLGFITRDDLEGIGLAGDVAVYIPFSYTWDGCLLMVPRSRVTPIEADSASIMSLVVSGGVSKV